MCGKWQKKSIRNIKFEEFEVYKDEKYIKGRKRGKLQKES